MKSLEAYPHVKCRCGSYCGVYTCFNPDIEILSVQYECKDCGYFEDNALPCREIEPEMSLNVFASGCGGGDDL